MAHRGRSLAIAVATGIGTEAEFSALPDGRRPHLTLAGVDGLLELLELGESDSHKVPFADS